MLRSLDLALRSVAGGVAASRTGAREETRRTTMLRIHDEMLDAIRSMRGALGAIDKRDADLARQLRRAASSVVLNIAEGSGSFGRVRTVRYRTALGSARETLASLQTAEAFGYVEPVSEAVTSRLNRVIGTLVRVAT
jgi:four helix bundle protein